MGNVATTSPFVYEVTANLSLILLCLARPAVEPGVGVENQRNYVK